MRKSILVFFMAFGICMFACSTAARATISYGTAGSVYSQDFNSLAAANAADDTPFTNDTTIPGWHLFTVTSNTDATPIAAGNYDTHTGGATAASYYSFGTPDGNGDRALGGIGGGTFYTVGQAAGAADDLASGSVAGWIAASITNNTGSALGEFSLSFNGEQWRRGTSNVTSSMMTMEYGFGSTFAGVSTWFDPGASFDWTTPRFDAGDANTLDGNVAGTGTTAGRVNGVGGTVTGLNWIDGSTLWLRWVELNDPGSDHGVAIDDLAFSAAIVAVPEASSFVFGGAICTVAGLWSWRQRRRRDAALA